MFKIFIIFFFLFSILSIAQEVDTMKKEQENLQKIFEQRQQDWRYQQIVYQIFVDRFARSKNFDDKKIDELFASPRTLKKWDEKPEVGKPLEEFGCWSHELDFWGGDLEGVTERIQYLNDLGVNTIYLNPIFHAFTNHKYDTLDYFTVDPQFGTWKDLQHLTQQAHNGNMKVVLDGVFNHVGKKSLWFTQAQNPTSPYRNFFYFGKQYAHGYLGWANVPNLPELNLENKELQKLIFGSRDSVVQKYLELVDGWRLDVAFDLGPEILSQITQKAHQVKKDSIVIGEIWNYPDGWLKVMDGMMNYPLRHVILELMNGNLTPSQAGRFINKMIDDSGIEKILQCWTILSSHDTPRMKELLPDPKLRELAIILQFTLPGAPVVYYGEELGMTGGEDPKNRGPMEWDTFTSDNNDLKFYRNMIQLRKKFASLQYGDFVLLESDEVFAFCRKTHLVKDTVIVLLNPQDKIVKTTLLIPEYRLMNWSKLQDALSEKKVDIFCGMMRIEMPPKSCYVLYPVTDDSNCYNPYKRVK